MYFPEHKLATEIVEGGHQGRDIGYEIERQKAIEDKLGFKFIRINSDRKNFDIFIAIGKIQNSFLIQIKN